MNGREDRRGWVREFTHSGTRKGESCNLLVFSTLPMFYVLVSRLKLYVFFFIYNILFLFLCDRFVLFTFFHKFPILKYFNLYIYILRKAMCYDE